MAGGIWESASSPRSDGWLLSLPLALPHVCVRLFCLFNIVRVQFNGVRYLHGVVQPSLPSVSRTFLRSNGNSESFRHSPFLLPSPWRSPFTFCLSLAALGTSYRWNRTVLVLCVWLIALGRTSSRFMLWRVSAFPSLVRLSAAPLCVFSTFCLSVRPSVDVGSFASSGCCGSCCSERGCTVSVRVSSLRSFGCSVQQWMLGRSVVLCVISLREPPDCFAQ